MTSGPPDRTGENGEVRQFPPVQTDPRARHPSMRADRDLPPDHDPMGKMALFSSQAPPAPTGTLLIDCSSCHRETPVSTIQLVRSAFPFSLHLPFIRRYHSFMRCPACGRHTWVRIRWQV
jgi:hypothetical protein